MLTRAQLLDEAQKQKAALATIGIWRRWLFGLTTTALVLAVFCLRGGRAVVPGIAAAVLTVILFLLLLLVNLSIRNGHRNVEHLLDSLKE